MSPASVWKTCLSVVYAGAPMFPFSVVFDRSLMWARTTSAGFPLNLLSCLPRIGAM